MSTKLRQALRTPKPPEQIEAPSWERVAILRRMAPEERLRLALEGWEAARAWTEAAVRGQSPGASDAEVQSMVNARMSRESD